MLWRTQLELHLRPLNRFDTRHKEEALGPKRLVCIEGIGKTLSQVWPHFSITLCSIREMLLMFPVAAVRWSTGDFMWQWSWGSGFECYFKTWIYQFPLRSKDRERLALQRVEMYSGGAVFWVAMVRVCPAVLCCNSLRNTMARVYSSADLWGCWSTYSRVYFSPPIAVVSFCQQMFCNSSCILLLGIEQKQTLKSNKHGNAISFLSLKNFFSCIFFAFHSRSEVLVLALQLEAVWVVSAYFYCSSSPPFHLLGDEGSVNQNKV